MKYRFIKFLLLGILLSTYFLINVISESLEIISPQLRNFPPVKILLFVLSYTTFISYFGGVISLSFAIFLIKNEDFLEFKLIVNALCLIGTFLIGFFPVFYMIFFLLGFSLTFTGIMTIIVSLVLIKIRFEVIQIIKTATVLIIIDPFSSLLFELNILMHTHDIFSYLGIFARCLPVIAIIIVVICVFLIYKKYNIDRKWAITICLLIGTIISTPLYTPITIILANTYHLPYFYIILSNFIGVGFYLISLDLTYRSIERQKEPMLE